MSTPNFAYDNRCVVVTNAMFEEGFYPQTLDYRESKYNGSRSYPSNEIDPLEYSQPKPLCHFIVLTYGYYGDACIDFVENEEFSIADWTGYSYHYASAKEFIDFLVAQNIHPRLTKYRVQKLMGKRGDYPLEMYLDDGIRKINEWLIDLDAELCNKIVDELKKNYECDEIVMVGCFSNGQGVYRKIG